MDRNSVLLALPIFAAPALVLLFALVNMAMPLSAATASILSYIILPLVEFGTIGLLAIREKMVLGTKAFLVVFLLGLVVIPLSMIIMYSLFVPTLVPMSYEGGAFPSPNEWGSVVMNTTVLGLAYIAFLAGWFFSQYLENKIYKTLTFLMGGFIVLFVLSIVASGIWQIYL